MGSKSVLSFGTNGPEVKELQDALRRAGFLAPNTGQFEARTQTAVVEFQKRNGLTPDGIVGPKTWSAIKGAPVGTMPEPKKGIVELSTVYLMCPDSPRKNIDKYWPMIQQHLEKRGLAGEIFLRLAIATVYTETRGFTPLTEFKSKYNTSPGGHPYDLYDSRADLGNQGAPDGDRFKGRGFIQLTGRENYRVFGEKLSVDLLGNPELANSPDVAAAVLCEYIKKRESMFASALSSGDLAKARKLVNGGSHGLEVFTASYNAWTRAAA